MRRGGRRAVAIQKSQNTSVAYQDTQALVNQLGGMNEESKNAPGVAHKFNFRMSSKLTMQSTEQAVTKNEFEDRETLLELRSTQNKDSNPATAENWISLKQQEGKILGTVTRAIAEEALRESIIEIPDELCTLNNEIKRNKNRRSQPEQTSVNSLDYDTEFFNEFIPTALEDDDFRSGGVPKREAQRTSFQSI